MNEELFPPLFYLLFSVISFLLSHLMNSESGKYFSPFMIAGSLLWLVYILFFKSIIY